MPLLVSGSKSIIYSIGKHTFWSQAQWALYFSSISTFSCNNSKIFSATSSSFLMSPFPREHRNSNILKYMSPSNACECNCRGILCAARLYCTMIDFLWLKLSCSGNIKLWAMVFNPQCVTRSRLKQTNAYSFPTLQKFNKSIPMASN